MGLFFNQKIRWFLVFFALISASSVQGASISDISITNSRDDLLVYLKIEGAFTGPIGKAVFSGVPTTFSFFITLEEIRTLWANKTIADTTITHTIKYNNLKKEFIITRSWVEEDPQVVKSFEEAQEMMNQVDSFKLSPLSILEKGQPYRVGIKAKLSKMSLPLNLHYFLLKASLWEFETDWHYIDFTY
jgi:hypothetical protein